MKVTPVGKNFNQHKIGTEFEIHDKAARILIRIGKLREVTAAVMPDEDSISDAEISPRTGKPKRTYQRRDMQAQS